MFQPHLAEQQDIVISERKAISTVQLGWVMKWFIMLHHDIITVIRK